MSSDWNGTCNPSLVLTMSVSLTGALYVRHGAHDCQVSVSLTQRTCMPGMVLITSAIICREVMGGIVLAARSSFAASAAATAGSLARAAISFPAWRMMPWQLRMVPGLIEAACVAGHKFHACKWVFEVAFWGAMSPRLTGAACQTAELLCDGRLGRPGGSGGPRLKTFWHSRKNRRSTTTSMFATCEQHVDCFSDTYMCVWLSPNL